MSPRPVQPTGELLERATCYTCFRPQAHCLCAEVTHVRNRTPILILQHPRERIHAFGTARLAEMILQRVEVVVAYQEQIRCDQSLQDRLRDYGLLYPDPDAVDLSRLAPEQRPKKLVLLDGTWSHARSMHRDLPVLQELPHFTLPAGLVSKFQIRKQPGEQCLSTLEAIYHALRALEPDAPGLEQMLRPFEAMQSRQLAAMLPGSPRSKKPSRTRKGGRVPDALAGDFDSLVVAYAESSTVGAGKRQRRLVAVAAARPSNGERARFVLKEHATTELHLSHMRLGPGDLEHAVTEAEFQAAWRSFLRPGDVLSAWNRSTLDLLQREHPDPARTLLLKAAYCNLRPCRGSLEDVVVNEGLLSRDELRHNQTAFDRTVERLISSLSIVDFLHAQGNQPPVLTADARAGRSQ